MLHKSIEYLESELVDYVGNVELDVDLDNYFDPLKAVSLVAREQTYLNRAISGLKALGKGFAYALLLSSPVALGGCMSMDPAEVPAPVDVNHPTTLRLGNVTAYSTDGGDPEPVVQCPDGRQIAKGRFLSFDLNVHDEDGVYYARINVHAADGTKEFNAGGANPGDWKNLKLERHVGPLSPGKKYLDVFVSDSKSENNEFAKEQGHIIESMRVDIPIELVDPEEDVMC